jgi:hypothetical protein
VYQHVLAWTPLTTQMFSHMYAQAGGTGDESPRPLEPTFATLSGDASSEPQRPYVPDG